jgi:hypothetical protein
MTTLSDRALLETSLLRNQLLAGAKRVGGVYHLDFHEALVSTDDKWKADAGGIPQHAFMLATVLDPHADAAAGLGAEDDEEVLLLRVDGSCQLPRQAELLEVREVAMRQMLTSPPDEFLLDNLTHQEMQRSGLRCRILGTFYETELPGRGMLLDFGSDLDNLYAASRYRVYKPSPAALEIIASYPQLTEDELAAAATPHLLPIGNVRYTSTRRRARAAGETQVSVKVRVGDFIEMKTAVFGMTRMGKSNTIKTLATAVFAHSQQINEPIGQLLFDPAGEYANVNVQDRTALAQLGQGNVAIYKYGLPANDTSGREPLQINFYDEAQLVAAQEVIGAVLAEAGASANYVGRFIGAQLTDPAPNAAGQIDFAKQIRARRARFCFYALLAKAEFECPATKWFNVSMKGELADKILRDQPRMLAKRPGGMIGVQGADNLRAVVDWLLDHSSDSDAADWLSGEATDAVLEVYKADPPRAGWRKLYAVRSFHTPRSGTDYAQAIYGDLVAGKIVIADLSRGTEKILQLLSERVINHILAQATERFGQGLDPHRMQVVIEEAHRLFDRKSYDNDAPNPYVRLAKEAAKFRIGLIYATQEVTAVAPAILANTNNWIVAHLNNSKEIAELSKYYDFRSYEDTILTAEDRGFIRLKTRSGKYIVPVQVAKFDLDMINRARHAAGLPPVTLASGSSSAQPQP